MHFTHFHLWAGEFFGVCGMSMSMDHRTLLYIFAECHNETVQLQNRFVRVFPTGSDTLYSEIKAKLGIQAGHSVGNASLCHILSW